MTVVKHKNGKVGGYLVGRRHSKGGIKVVNTDTGAPLEVESDEVIITRKAVLSDKKHEFNGKQMTNLEILSTINQQGGGVSLMKRGGSTSKKPLSCRCSGASHSYNGEQLSDRDILKKMQDGGMTEGVEQLADEVEAALKKDNIELTYHIAGTGSIYITTLAGEIRVADHGTGRQHSTPDYLVYKQSDVKKTVAAVKERLKLLQPGNRVWIFERQVEIVEILPKDKAKAGMRVMVKDLDTGTIKPTHAAMLSAEKKKLPSQYKEGGLTDQDREIQARERALETGKPEAAAHQCGCSHKLPHSLLPGYLHAGSDQYKRGGKVPNENPTPERSGVYKGTEHAYENPYQLNRAIEALLDSKTDDEAFSADEKRFFKYYSGYGGLEKYGATGVGLLYEYFTPGEIAKRMWGLAYKYGYRGGSILEPSCGVGEFFNFAPQDARAVGYEINPYSARITKILHPEVDVRQTHFEEIFISNRDSIRGKTEGLPKYDLVIGNPPCGKFEGRYAGMGEKGYTRASNYIEYFLLRSLDLLNREGLLVFIIGAEVAAGGIPFLQQQMNPIKREIAEKSVLLDAYRLPNGVFERTDVLTDIIVLQKI